MEEQNLPKSHNIKIKVVGLAVIVIALISSVLFGLDRLFTDFEPTDPTNSVVSVEEKGISYKGTIKYISPETYPEDNITYKLVNPAKETIILLKSKDEKLKVAENLTVTVKGVKTKTKSGNDVLIVSEIIVSN